MSRLRNIAGVLAVAALLLPACSQSRPSVTIGAMYPTSGPQAAEGIDELRGVRLAAEWANDHLPAGARPIKLATVAANRAEAVPGAMDALDRRGVNVVVGSHGS